MIFRDEAALRITETLIVGHRTFEEKLCSISCGIITIDHHKKQIELEEEGRS